MNTFFDPSSTSRPIEKATVLSDLRFILPLFLKRWLPRKKQRLFDLGEYITLWPYTRVGNAPFNDSDSSDNSDSSDSSDKRVARTFRQPTLPPSHPIRELSVCA